MDAASPRGDDAAPDFEAAYAVMCARISISLARVASSIVVLDVPRLRAPEVPVAPVVALGDAPLVPAVSLPARFVMMRSIAAISVPQLLELADAAPDPRRVALLPDARDAEGLSSAARCRRNSANCERSRAGIDVILMSLNASRA